MKDRLPNPTHRNDPSHDPDPTHNFGAAHAGTDSSDERGLALSQAASELLYDWEPSAGGQGTVGKTTPKREIRIVDETLRDGLQGGIPRQPTLDERLTLLEMSDRLGCSEAVIGFPAQTSNLESCRKLAVAASRRGVGLRLACLGRLLEADVENIARLSDAAQRPIVALLFVGASALRRKVEGWSVERLVEQTHEAVAAARRHGLPVIFGVEDGSRTEPEVAEQLLLAAVGEGAEGVSSIDTTGALTPTGTTRMVRHYRHVLDRAGYSQVRLDLHGHMDRGFGVANALTALDAGLDAIHCTALGLGERAGNYPLEHLLYNLKVSGRWSGDLSSMPQYCREVSRVCGVPIPHNHPIIGAAVFRTQVGLHAAAINKAEMQGEDELAGSVYSGVFPATVGRSYSVVVGPASGRHNVRMVLRRSGLTADDTGLERVLSFARLENRVLHDSEVVRLATRTSRKPNPKGIARPTPGTYAAQAGPRATA